MRNYLAIITFLCVLCNSAAQSSTDVGKIALSVVMPENVDGLDNSQLSKMETKIIQIVSAKGLAASGYNNNFVIYPKFAIYETNVVEGGMQNISVVSCELSLFIKQVDNNIIFSAISKSLKGSGNNKKTAITNAISKVSANDLQFNTFIETGKGKIIQYYETKCQDIITKSESLVKMQDYEQALGLLMTIPEEVSCYSKVQEKSIEAYKAFKNHGCKIQLQDARTILASNDYRLALHILSQIDPSTPCFKESQTLVNNAAAKVDIEDKKQWDLKMKIYDDETALQRQRINAVKDIAVAYYNSKPSSVNYTFLVR
jgi:hypothetical protein